MPGVPDEFMAARPLPEDGVLASMAALMPELSADDQARLEPFLVRPTDPRSIFHAQPTALVGGATVAEDPHPTARCTTWANSGDLDTRFKVWACADNDAAAAEIDIATVVTLLNSIWSTMVLAPPDGMGPPKADAAGPDPRNEHGGDGRIDFYLLDMGQIIRRDNEDNEVDPDAAAQAAATDPFTDSTSSGFVLLNRSRLVDEIDMRQDVIHEFFHVLQFAQNVEAPFAALDHWFVEASATWSEVYYDPAHSEIPHAWFGDFQASRAGLESTNPDHTYSAYIWPFFMQQEREAAGVFNAWAAIGGLGNGSYDAVSEAISDVLPFEDNFHEFAVRNLNVENTLAQAGIETYEGTDARFWENHPPSHMASATIVPGEPYISPPGGAAPLAADYYSFEVAESAREVTVSMVNVSPSDQVDGDALVHVLGGAWERRPLTGGMLKFCRDNPEDDIDAVLLVVSNRGRQQPLTGSVEASAKQTCSNDRHLGGTITWSRESHEIISDWERHITVSGTAQIVILVRDTGYRYDMTVERGSGSTYNYDYTLTETDDEGCETRETGTLETYAGVPDADFGDWSIGRLNPTGDLFEDLDLSFAIRDWCGPQMGKDIPEELRNRTFDGFLDCPEDSFSRLAARFDGSSSYVIDCSYEFDRSVDSLTHFGSGQVSGTLVMLDGPHPTPR